MRVVVDTNVLVAGLLSPFGPPAEIVRMIAGNRLSICFDARIITEYLQVLSRPRFELNLEDVRTLMEQARAGGAVVAAEPLRKVLPDPDDAPFLEVALAGRAECLITGNLRHFPIALRQGMRVLLPAAFLEFYRRRQQRQEQRARRRKREGR